MQKVKRRFTRSDRLLASADFQRVFKSSVKSADAYFTILCRKNSYSNGRLGMAISKKNLKRAVDRNLIKRIIRESFRKHQLELAGLDLIVMCRRGIPLGERALLRTSLEKHWNKVAARCHTA